MIEENQQSHFIESFDELYNNAQCGYITWLTTGEIVRINESCLNWLDYKHEDVINKIKFWDLLTVPGKIYYETHFAPLLFIQGGAKEIQLDIKTKSGEKIPVLINAVLAETSHEIPIKIFRATIFDIRQRKSYEKELLIEKRRAEEASQKLQIANNELRTFAKVVSHDLKSPLSGIVALSSMVHDKYAELNDEKFAISMNFIHDTSLKLSHLIDGILKYYLSESNYSDFIQTISLHKSISEILNLLPNENVHLSLPSEDSLISVNKSVFEQIVLNLISNSINYNNKENIELAIKFREDAEFYHFSITDNGPGIPESKFETIFELFKTLETKNRFNKKGSGIGLATVKKLVESAKGSISITSELNSFTTFQFSLKKL